MGASPEGFEGSWRKGPYPHRAELRRNGPWIELRGGGIELRARVVNARRCRRPRSAWRVTLGLVVVVAFMTLGVASPRAGFTIAALLLGPILMGQLLVTEWLARTGRESGATVCAELVEEGDAPATWWLVPGDVGMWITDPLGTRRAAREIHALLEHAASAQPW